MLRTIFLATACGFTVPALAQDAAPLGAGLIDLGGAEIGTVSLRQGEGGMLLEVEASGLPASDWIAIHLHEGDACDTAGGFESAGGHYAPGGNAHGYLAEGGPHAGDMPNQWVDGEGMLHAEIFSAGLDASDGGEALRGRTLIVHDGKDDYTSQPSGDAGDRIACGVIE